VKGDLSEGIWDEKEGGVCANSKKPYGRAKKEEEER